MHLILKRDKLPASGPVSTKDNERRSYAKKFNSGDLRRGVAGGFLGAASRPDKSGHQWWI